MLNYQRVVVSGSFKENQRKTIQCYEERVDLIIWENQTVSGALLSNRQMAQGDGQRNSFPQPSAYLML